MQIYHNQNQSVNIEKQLTTPRLPLLPTTPTLPPVSSISANNAMTMGSSGSHRSLDVILLLLNIWVLVCYLGADSKKIFLRFLS